MHACMWCICDEKIFGIQLLSSSFMIIITAAALYSRTSEHAGERCLTGGGLGQYCLSWCAWWVYCVAIFLQKKVYRYRYRYMHQKTRYTVLCCLIIFLLMSVVVMISRLYNGVCGVRRFCTLYCWSYYCKQVLGLSLSGPVPSRRSPASSSQLVWLNSVMLSYQYTAGLHLQYDVLLSIRQTKTHRARHCVNFLVDESVSRSMSFPRYTRNNNALFMK